MGPSTLTRDPIVVVVVVVVVVVLVLVVVVVVVEVSVYPSIPCISLPSTSKQQGTDVMMRVSGVTARLIV